MGLVIPQFIEVGFAGKSREHLLSLGYSNVTYRSKIIVNVLDLPESDCHSICSERGFYRIYGTKNNNEQQLNEYIENYKKQKVG